MYSDNCVGCLSVRSDHHAEFLAPRPAVVRLWREADGRVLTQSGQSRVPPGLGILPGSGLRPDIAHVGLPLFICRAVGHLNGLKAIALVKLASVHVFLESPKLQLRRFVRS